mgnify:FL=1
MNIALYLDAEQCVRELSTIIKFFNQQRNSVSYFRFPFASDMSMEVMRAVVEKELTGVTFSARAREVECAWQETDTQVINGVKEVALKHGVRVRSKYACYLTTLGPYGYFKTPNKIFINIVDADISHVMETIVHEVLHLALYEKAHHLNLTHEQCENLIDSQFKSGILKELFPMYRCATD